MAHAMLILLGLIGQLSLPCQGISLRTLQDPDAGDSARLLDEDIESMMKESMESIEEKSSDEPGRGTEVPEADSVEQSAPGMKESVKSIEEKPSDEPGPRTEAPEADSLEESSPDDEPEEMPSADAEPKQEVRTEAPASEPTVAEPAAGEAAERLPGPDTSEECKDAVPGDRCHETVGWALSEGLEAHPDYFPSFQRSGSEEYNFKQIQDILHNRSAAGCGKPCNMSSQPPVAEVQAPSDSFGAALDAAIAEVRGAAAAAVQNATDAEDQNATDAEDQNATDAEEEEGKEAEPTLEPMSSKSLSKMSPEDLETYLGDQDELDKYAYYLTHTSRRKRWEDEVKREHKV